MKATGIVRRIDDLGRVVIPKEIRNTFHIRESDPLEIYTGDSGEVIFKKYSAIGEIPNFASKFAELLQKEINSPILITDRNKIIAVSGASKSEFSGKSITKEVESLLEKRSTFIQKNQPNITIIPVENASLTAVIISPIITNGDLSGSIIALKSDSKTNPDLAIKLTDMTAKFISLMIEN